MNDRIVNALVENYKQKGVSLHTLLDDAIFKSLPVERQIEAIQAYAGVLQKGAIAPSGGKLIAKSIVKGTLAGAWGSIPLMAALKAAGKGNQSIPAAMGLAIAGSLVGGTMGFMQARQDRKEFDETNRYLARIAGKNDYANPIAAMKVQRGQRVDENISKAVDPGVIGKLLTNSSNAILNYHKSR
jgi:hypothetical protein